MKTSNRDKILAEGLRVVHERGFGGASVRDIVQAAGVPQGSFTNHFVSKEAFALEILDRYFAEGCERMEQTLRNRDLKPLDRLRDYLAQNKVRMSECGMRNGCLLGNFSAEATEQSEAIRARLTQIFAATEDALRDCIEESKRMGEIDPSLDGPTIAAFFVASFQGAILLAKTQRSLLPLENFEQTLFRYILR